MASKPKLNGQHGLDCLAGACRAKGFNGPRAGFHFFKWVAQQDGHAPAAAHKTAEEQWNEHMARLADGLPPEFPPKVSEALVAFVKPSRPAVRDKRYGLQYRSSCAVA